MIAYLALAEILADRLAEPDMADLQAPDFDAREWLDGPDNFALTDGRNILMVKEWADHVYEIDWLLRDRGREAYESAIDFLRYLFHKHEARVVTGLTPVRKRAARWFSRWIGGQSQGIIRTEHGDMEHFTMTRQDFEALHELPDGRQQK